MSSSSASARKSSICVVSRMAAISKTASAPPARASKNLILGENELFSENGQGQRCAHLFEMRHLAQKPSSLGQHRNGGGASFFVGCGDFGRLEALGNLSLGGGGLFHLGDDAHLAAVRILARIGPPERAREIQCRRRILRHGLDIGFGAPSLVRGDVLADAFHEFVENRIRRNRQNFIPLYRKRQPAKPDRATSASD